MGTQRGTCYQMVGVRCHALTWRRKRALAPRGWLGASAWAEGLWEGGKWAVSGWMQSWECALGVYVCFRALLHVYILLKCVASCFFLVFRAKMGIVRIALM